MFLLNAGTSNHYMVQTPKKKTIIWSTTIMASWADTHTHVLHPFHFYEGSAEEMETNFSLVYAIPLCSL